MSASSLFSGRLAAQLSAGLVALSIVAGSALDVKPTREPVFRAGYRVLEADFHAHTRFSDGFLSPFDLVIQAERRGLDVLAVTEHNVIFPGQLARWFARHTGGPTILVGEEVTTRLYHLHGVGLSTRIDASEPLGEVLRAIHAQGAIAIAAHPTSRYAPAYADQMDHLDAAEVMHPLAYGDRGAGWRWPEIRDFYANARADGHRLTAIGSSDYHASSVLGLCRTLVFARDDSEEAVMDALRAGRTVVYDLEGDPYGDAEMITALAREPYALRPQDYSYRGSGIADRITRALGLIGLFGLVLFGLRRGARVRDATDRSTLDAG